MSNEPLHRQLEVARRDLLELSTRNRLLNTPRHPSRGCALEVIDESCEQVFQHLVVDGKPMRFEQAGVSAPERNRQTDDILHTELEPEELDRRLLTLNTDSATSLQEQGINILYLVLGFLRWREADKTDVFRDAPLLLVPVRLQRSHAGNRFSLVYSGEEIETNLTLRTRLKIDTGLDLPLVPPVEDLSPTAYFQEVAKVVEHQAGWEVLSDDCLLWFFSFTKLLMYRDLAPETWPEAKRLEDQPLIRGLLGDGFPAAAPLCGDDEPIDHLLEPANTMHVIDCDSSQSLVVEEVCRGRSLVIQGPPGTGKSQTITNLIAAAVRSGKSILFIAEKMAALEVVKSRLDQVGIGDMCLELHSEKTNKRLVLQEIERTLKLGRPQAPPELHSTVKRLKELRDQLNKHADMMHAPQEPHGQSLYQVLTELIALRCREVPLPDFQLNEAPQWTVDLLRQRQQEVGSYCQAIAKMGQPSQHPWRGCQLRQVLPLDLERLLVSIPNAIKALDDLTQVAGGLGQRLGGIVPTTLSQICRLTRTANALLQAPKVDPQAADSPVWEDHRGVIGQIAGSARAILHAQEGLRDRVYDSAWDTPVAAQRQAYRELGQAWYRMFVARYRAARNRLKALLVAKPPSHFAERQAIFDLLHGYHQGRKRITEADRIGQVAFGRFWIGLQTDLGLIDQWEAWDARVAADDPLPNFRGLIGLIDQPDSWREQIQQVDQRLQAFIGQFSQLLETLQFDLQQAFDDPNQTSADVPVPDLLRQVAPAHRVKLSDLRQRLQAWLDQPERLRDWTQYISSRDAVASLADGALAARLDDGRIAADDGQTQFQFAVAESLLRDTMARNPQLAQFDGGKFERLCQEFRELDLQRLLLARSEVADAHYVRMSKPGGDNLPDAVALLKHEMQKKRRHLPLRQLLLRAAPAIQAVKPVFMMSPLSVAQYLEPGAMEFDILLIDEASQVRPVEALGAAARCRQMVCVGDDKQMPPTQFFGVTVGDVDLDEDPPEMAAGDVESVLSLCIARNMPQRMLRWHYRSRHHSLIAVSNRHFYNNQLYVIPSPQLQSDIGVKWHFIEEGRFLRGVNAVEAEVVAAAIMQHARERPQWTLGVGAFSISQRDAILNALEKLRRNDRGTDAFFDPAAPDPFFVKNLENIQGDERDVIFVSVGYGPGENGRVSLNFGPVSMAGGERRLNVLMTRAKSKCVIFSSMQPEDLDLTRATGQGPAAFRAYLEFARNGGIADAAGSSAARDRLQEVLKQQLEARDYMVQAHVGLSGVYVDLAVVDPDNPQSYLLGIELDGPSYRDARTARDRERLRPSVLQGQGWVLHRIWTLDWFQRPTEQFNTVIAAIEAARRRTGKQAAARPSSPFELERQPSKGDPLSAAIAGIKLQPLSADTGGKTEVLNTLASLAGSVAKVAAAGVAGGKQEAVGAVLKELGLEQEKNSKKSTSKRASPAIGRKRK